MANLLKKIDGIIRGALQPKENTEQQLIGKLRERAIEAKRAGPAGCATRSTESLYRAARC